MRTVDASRTDADAGAVPGDLVLLVGIFGIADEVRARFAAAGSDETHDSGGRPAIGVLSHVGPPVELRPDEQPLFTFLR